MKLSTLFVRRTHRKGSPQGCPNRSLATEAPNRTQLFSFGDSGQGQTGHPTLKHQGIPKKIAIDANDPIISVAAGEVHSLAVAASGAVYGFGSSQSGQLCSEDEFIMTPARLKIDEKVVEASAGKYHSLFLTESGEVYSAGNGASAQLGYLTQSQKQVVPRKIESLQGVKVKKLASGGFHCFALDEESNLFGWGQGHFGQTGTGIVDNIITPTKVESLDSSEKIIQISAGIFHSVVLTQQGNVYVWGGGKEGQLGQPMKAHLSIVPRFVSFDLEKDDKISQIAAGATFNIAVSEKGRFFSWGSNTYGQLGTGDTEMRLQPQEITWLHGSDRKKLQKLACGAFHSMARMEDGSIYVWGQGTDYQIGTNQRHILSSPTKLGSVPEGFQNVWVDAACGWGHSLVLTQST